MLNKFSNFTALLGTTPTFLKKKKLRNEVEFNAKSIDTNLKSQISKSKILAFPVLIAFFHFENYLIKPKQLNF